MSRDARWSRIVLLLAVLALLAGACRGDDGDDGDDTAATEDVAPTEEEATEEEVATEEPEEEATTEDAADDTEATDDETAAEITIGDGVTEEPCPDAVNPDNGCIYLGQMSDLTVGPFAAQGPQLVAAVNAFWQRVNEAGGIGGFDVDASTNTRDHQYNPEVGSGVYDEIESDILALTGVLGSPVLIALEATLESDDVLAIPHTWTSAWLFSPNVLESGSSYCIDAMNAVDYELANGDGEPASVMAIHFPGDYGDDGAAGTRAAAEANGLEFIDVPTTPGADNQGEAISRLVNENPDIVVMSVAPAELATIVGAAVAQGYEGQIYSQTPAFNEGLLESPAADLIQERVIYGVPWATVASDAPGIQAYREAMGDAANTTALAGWVLTYPLKTALETAVANGDLTRAGLVEAVNSITSVDYEGILPEDAGNLSGDANGAAIRTTYFAQLDGSSEFQVTEIEQAFIGPTAESYEFTGPCYEQ